MTLKTLLLWGAIASALSMTATAATIGPSCGTCQGGVYSLTYSTVSTNVGGLDTYNLFLNINTSSYNGGGTLIEAVAPKIVSNTLVSETLLSAPGGTAGWYTINGGLNAAGCDGSGAGFFCSGSNTNASAALVSSVNNAWTWQVAVTAGTPLLTGANAASLKVDYTDANGAKVGALVSEGITLTPSGGSWESLPRGD